MSSPGARMRRHRAGAAASTSLGLAASLGFVAAAFALVVAELTSCWGYVSPAARGACREAEALPRLALWLLAACVVAAVALLHELGRALDERVREASAQGALSPAAAAAFWERHGGDARGRLHPAHVKNGYRALRGTNRALVVSGRLALDLAVAAGLAAGAHALFRADVRGAAFTALGYLLFAQLAAVPVRRRFRRGLGREAFRALATGEGMAAVESDLAPKP